MLSIVVASRNDNHGGKLVERTNLFVNSLQLGAKATEVDTELIIVEWNPPSWARPLHEVIHGDFNNPFFRARIITVSEEVHRRFENSQVLDFYQMIAKNVGIRRAKGDWILSTNPDLVFPIRIFEHVAELEAERVRLSALYRVLRQDAEPCDTEDADEAVKWCSNHHTKLGEATWEGLHTWACGDFTMLHREDWASTRGYPELEIWSIHVDSLFLLFANRVCGIKEILWEDTCVYHPEHQMSWSVNPEYGVEWPSLRDKLAAIVMTVDFFAKNGGRNLRWNPATWGLAQDELPEVRVC
jgi:hypothetical protein